MKRIAFTFLSWCVLVVAACSKSSSTPTPDVKVKPPEPEYTAEDQLKSALARLRENGVTRRQAAMEELVKLNAEIDVVPSLIDSLKDTEAVPLGKFFPNQLLSTREAAVKALLTLGAKGEKPLLEQGIPLLRDGLKDPKANVREHTCYAILLMGAKAKPLAEDVAKLCADKQKEVRAAAYAALEEIKSVPEVAMLKLLSSDDPGIASDAAEALRWLKPTTEAAVAPLTATFENKALEKKDEKTARYVRDSAATTLAGMGDQAKSALPALIKLIQETTVDDLNTNLKPGSPKNRRSETGAMRALRRFGKPAVPGLMTLLKNEKPVVRWQAVTILGGIGPDASEALDAIQNALEQEKDAFIVVSAAALAYVQIGGKPEKPLMRLGELLMHEQETVRGGAAAVLQRYGRDAAPLVEKIAPLLDDPNEEVRLQAVETLKAIGSPAKSALPALLKRLEDGGSEVKIAVLKVIGNLGTAAPETMVLVKKMLESKDLPIQEAAVDAVRMLGPAAKDAAPEIVKILESNSPNPLTHLPAIEALAAIGPAGKVQSVPVLMKRIDIRDTTVRTAIVEALGRVEASDTESISRLAQVAQKDSFGTVRMAAIKSLALIGPPAKDAATALETLAKGNASDMQLLAAAALVRMKIDEAANWALIHAALKDKTEAGRSRKLFALELFEVLGKQGKAALPELTELLKDRTPIGLKSPTRAQTQVREKATTAMSYLGEDAKTNILLLMNMLDAEESVKRTVVQALKRMGPAAVDAVDKLKVLMRTEPDLADEIQEALDRIAPSKE